MISKKKKKKFYCILLNINYLIAIGYFAQNNNIVCHKDLSIIILRYGTGFILVATLR